ncbi:hypothetical protein M8C21_004765 [Ambrosia artemisiifolia]|uniref:Uncharacterized protein n=1 Tax=Ambrosia artemisiifolia TaxID=4212 RepID=A0AAD5DEB6_AMBAR|nr:hypothetical protein M8C21_004765 [Ambrosia artemisiifolia]
MDLLVTLSETKVTDGGFYQRVPGASLDGATTGKGSDCDGWVNGDGVGNKGSERTLSEIPQENPPPQPCLRLVMILTVIGWWKSEDSVDIHHGNR